MEGTLVMPTYLPITRVLFIGTWYRIVAGQTSRLPRAFSYHYVAVRLDTIFSRKQKQTSNVCRYHEQRFQRPFKRLSYQQDKIKKKERKERKRRKKKGKGTERKKKKERGERKYKAEVNEPRNQALPFLRVSKYYRWSHVGAQRPIIVFPRPTIQEKQACEWFYFQWIAR